ncbi:hypothetical protein ACOIDV_28315, partial [Klebsiella pneumoniae]
LKWLPKNGYTGRTVFGTCALRKPVTSVKRVGSSEDLEKPPLVAVVFLYLEVTTSSLFPSSS